MADETLALLIDALDSDDEVRRILMVALALLEAPVVTEAERERLRREGLPPVFRL